MDDKYDYMYMTVWLCWLHVGILILWMCACFQVYLYMIASIMDWCMPNSQFCSYSIHDPIIVPNSYTYMWSRIWFNPIRVIDAHMSSSNPRLHAFIVSLPVLIDTCIWFWGYSLVLNPQFLPCVCSCVLCVMPLCSHVYAYVALVQWVYTHTSKLQWLAN